MKFFLIARFLSRNNSSFPIFFSFFLKKKELEFLIFLKFFDISFFFLQKKKKTVKCNEKYWKYFLTKLDLLKPLKSSKLESCQ